jgi:hypothetical protein
MRCGTNEYDGQECLLQLLRPGCHLASRGVNPSMSWRDEPSIDDIAHEAFYPMDPIRPAWLSQARTVIAAGAWGYLGCAG